MTEAGHLVWRRGRWSLRLRRRGVAALLGLALALGALALASLCLGEPTLGPGAALRALLGPGDAAFAVGTLRAPRLLTGLCAGACLGLSGAMMQSLARNPLASPDLLGFTQGAGLGAVATIARTGAQGVGVAAAALGGGLAAAVLVGALAWKGGLRVWRLVLVGIGVGFALRAGTDVLMTRTDLFSASAATQWLTGSLNARLWSHAAQAGVGLAVLGPLGLALGRGLDRLEMGEDVATALGVRTGLVRLATVAVAVGLAAVAVAACGPVAFVALVAGPIGRRLSGGGGPALGPAALTGALLLCAADLAGRVLLAPMQLPAGLFTALIGAPYLLWLLATQIRKGAL
ncbi:FecCD family ABC transporter permease [Rubellimicrobium aerolatum]|uniref:FecCD family ABC transporter permease n=1 Tax=Rubellimicrobium aerolatum TaxID=490979 RepID=A0ABW0SGS1_9RHOB|nr:iron chelate uptake ABC transporter family permease subunit [Rubellimicrobium aerolatum]MBP1807532.1 iron complex transport system permease protein [Rubellimicrobium aerolatum]